MSTLRKTTASALRPAGDGDAAPPAAAPRHAQGDGPPWRTIGDVTGGAAAELAALALLLLPLLRRRRSLLPLSRLSLPLTAATTAGGLAAALLLGTSPAAAAQAQPTQESSGGALQLILDSSGSMAAQDPSGGTKIDAARAALGGVVDALPDGATVGVRAYGGTFEDKARGCGDTRLIVPMDTLDRTAAKSAFAGLKPLGFTPIAASLERAAADFTGEGARRILLVSDGEETCGGNPCQVAKTLEASGIDLTVDTVGYAADAATKQQLACIAEATGGSYSEVADGAGLQRELSRTALRAYREFQPTGTRVTGTPTAANAPAITAGQYVDELEKGEVAHYRLERPRDAKVYVAATLVPPRGDYDSSSLEGVSVVISNAEGVCVRESGLAQGQGDGVVPVTTVASFTDNDGLYGCEDPGSFDVAVERYSSDTDVARVPVELLVLFEPPAQDVAELPDPTVPVPGAPQPPVASGGDQVIGAGSFAAAPLLEPGTHLDALRPGETSFYRVPVGWGQRLNVTATVNGTRYRGMFGFVPVRLTLYNPAREELDANGTEAISDSVRVQQAPEGSDVTTVHGWTAPITYRNREAERTGEVLTASLGGEQYLSIALEDGGNENVAKAGLLPTTLAIEVLGEEQGAPAYGKLDGAAPATEATVAPSGEPSSPGSAAPAQSAGDRRSSDPADGSRLEAVAYVGGGIAASLIAGALLLAPWLRRRAQSPH